MRFMLGWMDRIGSERSGEERRGEVDRWDRFDA